MTRDARRFFDAIAGRYDRDYAMPAQAGRARMKRVLELLPAPPARVLDLGVGTGRELASLQDAGHLPTGVDVSPQMLERCARRARPVPLVEADFWGPLPLAESSHDAAIALHGTLAHPPDEAALEHLGAELARVLRPGGVLLAEVPSLAWLERLDGRPTDEGLTLRRTGPRSCVFEDARAAVSIEASVLSEDEWKSALGQAWRVDVERLGEAEWLVRGTPVR